MKITKARLRQLIYEENKKLNDIEELETNLSDFILKEVDKGLAEQIIPDVYEMECSLTFTNEINITDIFTELRAIEGVTVVSATAEAEDAGVEISKSIIKVKFLKGKRVFENYVNLLIRGMSRINGVRRVKVIKVRKLEQQV
jgi:hypothetical protein